MNKYLMDTNIINHVLDGIIPMDKLNLYSPLYVTHIQKDEILKTLDNERRRKLMRVLSDVSPSTVVTSGAIYGVSNYGGGTYTSHDNSNILDEYIQKTKKRKNFNRERDALMATTVINDGYILLTNDDELLKFVNEKGGQAIKVCSRKKLEQDD